MDHDNLRDLFGRAAEGWVATVETLDESDWTRSALGAWDGRALVGHTLRAFGTIDRFLADAGPEGTPEIADAAQYYRTVLAEPAIHHDVERRGVDAGAALGDEPAATVRSAVAATLSGLAAADEALVGPTAAGSMRLGAYLETRLVELVVHHRDLCAAMGTATPPLEGIWERVFAVVAATANASQAQAATLALLGRAVLPDGFNLFSSDQA
ncbi:MAG: hypothetical protein GX868_04040 [Actinobacteria bacterium]|nr:hypothetical protein [Actinomycetota bacterium]